jgi:hypothetical protein
MEGKRWRNYYASTIALVLRLLEPWAGSRRVCIGDAGFGSFAVMVALHSVLGLYSMFVVKRASASFPMKFLKDWGD